MPRQQRHTNSIPHAARRSRCALALAALLTAVLGGCSLVGWKPSNPEKTGGAEQSKAVSTAGGEPEITQASYFEDVARKVSYDAEPSAGESKAGNEPFTARSIQEPTDETVRPLSLTEAVQTALLNSRIIRLDAEFLSNRNSLLNNPAQTPSVYDVDIVRDGVTFGQRGEEAALAEFAPRLTTNMLWSRDENIQNNLFQQGVPPGTTFYEEAADFNSRIEKVFMNGSTAALRMDWDYSLNNSPARLFGSEYRGVVAADYRHPLLRGAGREVNGIVGTGARFTPNFNGLNQGVVIARINAGISTVQLETDVRNQVFDVQQVYWDLYLAFQQYEVQRDNAKALDRIWTHVKTLFKQGLAGGSAAEEAQAADNYYQARSSARQSLATVYETEGRLRRLLGLPANDGKLLKPTDTPTEADFLIDWPEQVGTALSNRIELRRQQMEITSLRLQLLAARNLAQPQADFVASYRVNAFGDKFIEGNDNDGLTTNGLRAANRTLFQGDQTGWNLGFEVAIPFGFPAERAQIRQLEWRLLKARTALAEQELEIQHELQNAVTRLQRWQTDMRLARQRQQAADRRVAATEAGRKAGIGTVDLRLRARISSGEARVALVRAISEYNKAIANFYYRNGTMLARNGVRVQGAIRPEMYETLGLKDELRTSTLFPEPDEVVESPELPDGTNAPQPVDTVEPRQAESGKESFEWAIQQLPDDVIPAHSSQKSTGTPRPATLGQPVPQTQTKKRAVTIGEPVPFTETETETPKRAVTLGQPVPETPTTKIEADISLPDTTPKTEHHNAYGDSPWPKEFPKLPVMNE